jgi:septum formation protein
MDKAGSYAIQGLGAKLIDHYTGSFNNIVGLPIEEVSKTLKEVL